MAADPQHPSFPRYLAWFGGALLCVLLGVWAYVAAAPMAFMESGYAAWAAKSTLLRECRLGQVALFGDSRLEAGVIPASLPVETSNFGLAAGTAAETYTAVQRALACPNLPRQAVIALVPEHFGPFSRYFWILTLRYGFLSPAELGRMEAWAAALGDRASFAAATPDGLSGPVRDWLYVLRFPSLSFGSLVQGRVFGRDAGNRLRYAEALQARGWARYSGELGGDVRGAEAAMPTAFRPTQLQQAAFEAAIGALRARGVEVLLLPMPFARSHTLPDAVESGYLAYLAEVARRTEGVRLLDDRVPVWPDRLFADGAHLDEAGAQLFSARLASCVRDGALRPGCDLQWAADSAVLEMEQERHR